MERSQRALKAQQTPDRNPPVTPQVPDTTSVMTFNLFCIQYDIPTKVYCIVIHVKYVCWNAIALLNVYFTFSKAKAKESAKTFLIPSAPAYSETRFMQPMLSVVWWHLALRIEITRIEELRPEPSHFKPAARKENGIFHIHNPHRNKQECGKEYPKNKYSIL